MNLQNNFAEQQLGDPSNTLQFRALVFDCGEFSEKTLNFDEVMSLKQTNYHPFFCPNSDQRSIEQIKEGLLVQLASYVFVDTTTFDNKTFVVFLEPERVVDYVKLIPLNTLQPNVRKLSSLATECNSAAVEICLQMHELCPENVQLSLIKHIIDSMNLSPVPNVCRSTHLNAVRLMNRFYPNDFNKVVELDRAFVDFVDKYPVLFSCNRRLSKSELTVVADYINLVDDVYALQNK